MDIKKGLPQKYYGSAADLVLSSLGEKFYPILGRKDKARQLLSSSINPDNCISVVHEGDLLGILAFQTGTKTFLNPSFSMITSLYGFVPGTLKALGLSLLEHITIPGEIYVEAVAVSESVRGKGIGTQLFRSFFRLAKENDYKEITLYVIGSNKRAKALYERLGFETRKIEKIWPLNWILGWPFDEVCLMRKKN